MIQTIYDSKKNGLYRDKVKDFFIDRLFREVSMTESHYHPYYEFFYMVKGSCRIFADHSLFTVNEGEIVILPPSTLHRTQYDNKVERITMSLTISFIDSLKDILGDNFFNNNFCSCKLTFSKETSVKLENSFNEILLESDKNDDFSKINIKSLITNLLVVFARNIKENKNTIQGTDETKITIEKAAQFIFENYDKEITLQMAAKIAGMRDTYFSRRFFEITGYGFKEYLMNLRIQHSQELLLTSKLTITQIAILCGFSNSNYFGDAFKKKTGFSPRDFRKIKEDLTVEFEK